MTTERQDIKTAIDMLNDMYDGDSQSLDNISLNHCVNVLMDCGNEIAAISAQVLELQAERDALQFSWNGCSQQLEDACEDLNGAERRTLELQAAIVTKDEALKMQIRYKAHGDGYIEEALTIKPSNPELRKLIAKHVRHAIRNSASMDGYADKIEDGSAPL